jgi:hypothetical protein
MRDAWKNLWPSGRVPDQQKLIDYLEGKLSPEEKIEMERILTDSTFVEEALEGLSQIKDRKRIPHITDKLNEQLRDRLRKSKARPKHSFPLPEGALVNILTVLVIILILIAYMIYHMYTQR